jgi:nitric oxide reductase NorD protein
LLKQCPGLTELRKRLGEALLSIRPEIALPNQEHELEKAMRSILGSPGLDIAEITSTKFLADPSDRTLRAAAGYKPFRPAALWPLILEPRDSEPDNSSNDEMASDPNKSHEGGHSLKVSRKDADQADRKDSFILHRFESILSMMDFLNINRTIEDDDEANVKKAAEDSQQASFTKSLKSPKTKLKFHLDLAPQDVDTSRLIGERFYPEWNWKTQAYLPDYVHVEERLADEASTAPLQEPAARRQIEAVRRQFEALRPRKILLKRQPDGHDLDIDEAIRARCDLLASGETSDRLYYDSRNNERDLGVSVLFDASRSTEAYIGERSAMDIGKQVVVALCEGITACGDEVSIHAFSSLKRERVIVTPIKSFEENLTQLIHRRIMGLKPSYYTRMGAAIRHVSSYLGNRNTSHRLLLLITDGRPNDLDHYEGRYGIEDTRRSVMEARRLGHAVFGITIDSKSQQYAPYIFGPSGFAIIPDAQQLINSLPLIYKHLTS